MNRTTPLRRTGPIKRRGHKDPVDPRTAVRVFARDRGCLAPQLSGELEAQACGGRLTLDHVRDQPMAGKRAPSDERHLATVCENHHIWTGWATSHRPELRAYLAAVNPLAAFSPEEEHPV